MEKYIRHTCCIKKDIPNFDINILAEAMNFAKKYHKLTDVDKDMKLNFKYHGHVRDIGKEDNEYFGGNNNGKLRNTVYATTYWRYKLKYIKCQYDKEYIYKDTTNGIEKIKEVSHRVRYIDVVNPNKIPKIDKDSKYLMELVTSFYATSWYKKYMTVTCPSKRMFDIMLEDSGEEFCNLCLENDYFEKNPDADLTDSDPESNWDSADEY